MVNRRPIYASLAVFAAAALPLWAGCLGSTTPSIRGASPVSSTAGFIAYGHRSHHLKRHTPAVRRSANGARTGEFYRPAGDPRGNYLSHLDGEDHWTHFPLTVAFVHDANYSAKRQATITAGFNQWVTATGGDITFKVTSSPATAEIVVRCDPSRDDSVTNTSFDPDNHTLNHADVRVGVADPDDHSVPMSMESLQGVSAHEFGHALGINGHSNNPQDLMYPIIDENRFITPRDLNTLRAAYPA